jgi:TM2 domain-containing membrane protein YozV
MDYRSFEQRLLDTIFTTDVQLNPATIAFLYKIPVQEASDLLQQAAVQGLLNIESDDEGNILYTYPHRVRLLRDSKRGEAGGVRPGAPSAGLHGSSGALVPQRSAALAPQSTAASTDHGDVALVLPQHIDMTEVASEPSPSAATAPPLSAQGGSASAPGAAPAGGPGTMRCPFCSEVILVGAKKCKHCHEYLDYAMRDLHTRQQAVNQVNAALVPYQIQQNQLQQWSSTSATQAALLSFFVPGLGQMCSGRVPAGLLWMMFTCLGYVCFIVPGIVLHILCVINAARQPRQL